MRHCCVRARGPAVGDRNARWISPSFPSSNRAREHPRRLPPQPERAEISLLCDLRQSLSATHSAAQHGHPWFHECVHVRARSRCTPAFSNHGGCSRSSHHFTRVPPPSLSPLLFCATAEPDAPSPPARGTATAPCPPLGLQRVTAPAPLPKRVGNQLTNSRGASEAHTAIDRFALARGVDAAPCVARSTSLLC